MMLFTVRWALRFAIATLPFTLQSAWAIEAGVSFASDYPAQSYGILEIDSCTAIAVSSSTLLMAAHCGAIQSGRACVRRQSATAVTSDACALRTEIAPEYVKVRDSGADVGVAIFPSGTFSVFATLFETEPKIGATVLMVGFAEDGITGRPNPGGRWGRNVIHSIQPGRGDVVDRRLVTRYGATMNSVQTNPGDSGGPLFIDCRLAGLSQGGGFTFPPDAYHFSSHTNLSRADLRSWFRTLRAGGAEFCGLPGFNAARCPEAGRLTSRMVLPSQGNLNFPCTSASLRAAN